jgi:FtsZ-binding cell division protein ZapB
MQQLETKWKRFLVMFPNYRNMPETKRKICVWVSTDMYNRVVKAGYDSPTVAVIKGFELLLGEAECRQYAGNLEQAAAQITADNSTLKNEVQRLTLALQDTPDPVELAQVKVRYEELEKHNETLKAELEKAERDKEDLKNTYNKLQDTYNNYMAQMQTLIKQKAIEVPGTKKPWWRFW